MNYGFMNIEYVMIDKNSFNQATNKYEIQVNLNLHVNEKFSKKQFGNKEEFLTKWDST